MRISPVLPAIVVTAIASVYGCSLPLEGLPAGDGGAGGATSETAAGGAPRTTTSTSSASTSSTGTGEVECSEPKDCGADAPCLMQACTKGRCVRTSINEGMRIPDAVGNCKQTHCEHGSLVVEEDPQDSPASSGQCTLGVCNKGKPTQRPVDNGTSCGMSEHCLDGECHQCAFDENCKDTDSNPCTSAACTKGVCGLKDDSGGDCQNGGDGKCVVGKCCSLASACPSAFSCCGPTEHCTAFSGCKPNP